MASEVVRLYMDYPAKHRDQFYRLLLVYVLNQKTWICSDGTDTHAFDQLHLALRRLKREPFNLSTEIVESIVENCDDWMQDLMDMEKFNGRV